MKQREQERLSQKETATSNEAAAMSNYLLRSPTRSRAAFLHQEATNRRTPPSKSGSGLDGDQGGDEASGWKCERWIRPWLNLSFGQVGILGTLQPAKFDPRFGRQKKRPARCCHFPNVSKCQSVSGLHGLHAAPLYKMGVSEDDGAAVYEPTTPYTPTTVHRLPIRRWRSMAWARRARAGR